MRMLFVVMALVLAWGPMGHGAAAAVVGRLTQVDGRVDLLKGGSPPAVGLKVGDSVETGDVVRSKSLSKAQITFMDNSIITLAPETRLAIDDYRFDPALGKRRAVLELFQGLAHVLVNKIFKVEEPDFVIKTHTAVTGVRGTDFGIRLQPNSSTILNFEGRTRVGSIFPELGAWLKRARTIAFQHDANRSFFSPGSFVDLGNMQSTMVQRGFLPTMPMPISPQDQHLFMNQMASGLFGKRNTGGTSGAGGGNPGPMDGGAGTAGTSSTVPAGTTLGLIAGTGNTTLAILNTVTVPPPVTPTSSTFNFTQQYYAAWLQMANAPYDQAKLVAYSYGQRTGVYDGYFYGTTEATRTAPSGQTNFFQGLSAGTSVGTATGTVTGILGQTLNGTMTYTGTTSLGSTINRTGTVTLLPSGAMTYVWTDTVSGGATGTGTSTQTPGTYFTQTSSGQVASEANLAGNQQVNSNVNDLTGTRTIAGITSSFRAGFSVNNVATNANTFSSSDSHDITIESRGVLGPPDAAGARTGVMINVSTTNGGTDTTGGPVTVVPATSTTPAATFAQVLGNPTGTNNVTGGVWVQTSDSSGQIVTQAYQGSLTVNSSPPHTTGTLNGSGWGFRVESGSNGYFTTGSMTATITDTGGGTFGSNADIFNQTMAAVVKPDASNNRVGPAVGVGLVSNNAVVSTTGTVTIDPSNIITHNFNGTWISPDSHGTLTAGTQTLTPGDYFQQTTNTGTGTAALSTPTTTAPYTQTSTLSATMTRTEVAPASNLTLAGTSITSSTATANALPGGGTGSAIVNIQGVVASSGTVRSGNMTVTTHQGSNKPVSTYVGPVSIDTGNNTLNGTIVGRNFANPLSPNRVSATQTGIVSSGPPN
ncbi:MAG: FecR family protein [Desulfobaccales bacterium]